LKRLSSAARPRRIEVALERRRLRRIEVALKRRAAEKD
jgi:hypothetical protein